MSIIDVPTSPGLQSVDWAIDKPAQETRSTITDRRKVAILPQKPRWYATAVLPPIIGEANILAWRAFVVDLDGIANSFKLVAVENIQISGINPTVTTSGLGGYSLPTTGWGGPGLKLKRGQMVTIAHQLLMLMENVVADASGNATIRFKSYLRVASQAGAPITVDKPYSLVSSVDSKNGWSVGIGQNYAIKFAVKESF